MAHICSALTGFVTKTASTATAIIATYLDMMISQDAIRVSCLTSCPYAFPGQLSSKAGFCKQSLDWTNDTFHSAHTSASGSK